MNKIRNVQFANLGIQKKKEKKKLAADAHLAARRRDDNTLSAFYGRGVKTVLLLVFQ